MAHAAHDASYWSQDASALAAKFGGLKSERAAAQLAAVGPNTVEDAPRLSALWLLPRQFESPLVLILAFAASISLILQQLVDTGIILAIVLGSALLGSGLIQTQKAMTAARQTAERKLTASLS